MKVFAKMVIYRRCHLWYLAVLNIEVLIVDLWQLSCSMYVDSKTVNDQNNIILYIYPDSMDKRFLFLFAKILTYKMVTKWLHFVFSNTLFLTILSHAFKMDKHGTSWLVSWLKILTVYNVLSLVVKYNRHNFWGILSR